MHCLDINSHLSHSILFTGIQGIEEADVGGKVIKPSKTNTKLLWKEEREGKQDYSNVEMEAEGVPKNYKEKNARRVDRMEKKKNKIKHEVEMKKERRKERKEHRKKREQKKELKAKQRKEELKKEKRRQKNKKKGRKDNVE